MTGDCHVRNLWEPGAEMPRATRPSAVPIGVSCRSCPACHCDIRRPPRHHLRVPLTELEDEGGGRVAFSMAWAEDKAGTGDGSDRARTWLAGFRRELYWCLGRRRDALFELADAVLCGQGRVQMLAELSLEPEHQRGHGALYDALNCGSVQIARLRWALAAVPLPGWDDGRIRLAVDVSNWLRPDAATSPGRSFCHCYGRGKNSAQMIPGWPYSFVAALEPGRTSWVRLLDAIRLTPDDDLAAVTAAQVREVTGQIIAAGHWHRGDPDILVIFDAGYEPARLAWLLADLPVQVLGRLGTNRVLRQAPPPRQPGQMGRPVRHGRELKLSDDAACPGPDVHTTTETSRYGAAEACAWHRMHPKLNARGAWEGHRETAGHRGHPHQADRRSPAARSHPQAGMAVDLPPGRRSSRSGPVLAGVPAPF